MKHLKLALLISFIILPVITLFYYDARFTSLENAICRDYATFTRTTACTYPERSERERLITTAFYRHLGDILGRDVGTSPSWIDGGGELQYETGESSVQSSVKTSNLQGNNSQSVKASDELAWQNSEVKMRLEQFNFSLLIAMIVSFMVSASAMTIAIQKLFTNFHSIQPSDNNKPGSNPA